MEVRASNLRQFSVRFLDGFCNKNRLNHDSKQRLKTTSIFHRFFVVFGLELGGSWRGLGTKDGEIRIQKSDLR